MFTIIKNGRVIDPANGIDGKLDIVIENGRISRLAPKVSIPKKVRNNTRIVDASGKLVVPGLIDIHVHLREPGREDEETIRTGTRAAAHGGFTSICAMPNTDPPVDSVAGIKFLLATARTEGIVNVFPLGCITKGRKGEELAEIGKMHRAGIVGITDDGSPVMNSQIMRHALEYVRMAGIPVVSHCEDLYLSQNGVMNEGYLSTVMGLKGIPAQAETTMIARDIALAELTGGHLHIAHVSSAGSVTLIREAKRRKLSVTGETAPHYFSLTEEAVGNYNTMAKVNPPLRSHADVRAIIRGLKDGTIDAIASDHAPHTEEEKQTEFNTAPAGLIGLETTVPIVFTYLVKKKLIDLKRAVELMSSGPAGIFGLKRGTLSPGAVADVTIIDPRRELVINKEWFVSKSRNSPFIGKKLTGFAEAVFVSGKQVLS